MNKQLKFSLIILFFTFFASDQLKAQDKNFYGIINPSFNIGLDLNSERWSQSFGIAHRDDIYYNGQYNLRQLFLELGEYTSYSWKGQRVGFKVKYRFKHMYTGKHNELRIAQDYSISIPLENDWSIGQKFSIEERFKESFFLRPRYKAAIEKKLTKTTDLGANGELLLNFGPQELPVYEYRASAFIEFLIFSDFSATFGAQYRYEDFTRDATKEIYLISGFDLRL